VVSVQEALLVRYDVAEHVATITFDRPEKLNAITFAMRDAFLERLETAEADPEVRVLIVTGNGSAFTSGVDVNDRPDLQDPVGRSIAADEAEIERAAGAWERMLKLSKPILVKAHGYCVGWGLEIALHADIVLASEDCKFFYPSVTRGTGLPDSSTTMYHLGPQWSKRLLMAGEVIDGVTAERIGLVSETLPADELDAALHALARRTAAVAPEILAQSKRVINESIELMGRAALQQLAVKANATVRRQLLVRDETG
jgi:enoyl-CoA hydratase